MNDYAKAFQIYQDILKQDDKELIFEDFKDEDTEFVAERFGISVEAAALLKLAADDSPFKFEDNADLFASIVEESLYDSLEGYTDGEKLVITAYLSDIALAMKQASK